MTRFNFKALLAASLLLFGLSTADAQVGGVIQPSVQGPASATSGHIATFNGTTGRLLQDGGAAGTGSVTSVGSGSCLTGGPITTTGTLAGAYLINPQTGTSYTIQTTDACKLVSSNNASAVAWTLPVATTSGFGVGFSFDVQNLGAGTLTITPTTSTINGGASIAISQNQGCTIVSDGTNYQVSACTALSGSGGFPITIGSTAVAANSTTTTIAGLTLTSPTLTTPALGTPASGVMTNLTGTPSSIGLANGTGLPISGITGLGTGVGTALAAAVSGTGSICLSSGSACGGGGVTSLAGTANQITASASTGAVTLSLPSAITLPGTIVNPTNAAVSSSPSLFSGTPVTGGTATTNFPLVAIWTAGATGPTTWSAAGTMLGINAPSGFTGSLIDMHANGGGNIFNVSAAGAAFLNSTLTIGSTATLTVSGRSKLGSTADGQFLMQNNAGSSFTRLELGGTTSSFPAIARNGTALNFVLADASGDAAITAAGGTFSGALINTGITTDATHTDASVCEDTTTHQFYFGSGTLGICLGTSSARYKHGIKALAPGLSEIMALKPKTYFLNADRGDPTKMYYGFIAEDVVSVLPKIVGLDAQNRPNSVDYVSLIPVLVNAAHEQQREIDYLWIAVGLLFAGLAASFVWRR